MKYVFDINEETLKGKETINAIIKMGVHLEPMIPEKIISEKLGLPGYNVSQNQMQEWLNDSIKSDKIDFSTIADI
jgi:hypothetical protein